MADVRVGIVSWNTAALLDKCLAAVPHALGDLDAEVTVVDNASADGSAAVAANHGGVTVIRSDTNDGYARGMNRALSDTDAPVLIALNPDTVPRPGSLRALVLHLRDNPGTGLVAPRLVGDDGRQEHSVHRFASLRLAAAANLLPVPLLRGKLGRRLSIEGSTDHFDSGPIDWAIGAVHAIRASASGPTPYSERWFMYVEDLELCWRLRQAGWRIDLRADVEVQHTGNASGKQLWGGARTRQWLAATYDWYAATHGVSAARAYAAINLVGATVKGSAALARGRARRDGDATRWGHELMSTVSVHAQAVRHPDAVYADPFPLRRTVA